MATPPGCSVSSIHSLGLPMSGPDLQWIALSVPMANVSKRPGAEATAADPRMGVESSPSHLLQLPEPTGNHEVCHVAMSSPMAKTCKILSPSSAGTFSTLETAVSPPMQTPPRDVHFVPS